MFYFNGERWLPFEKKITYTEQITEYDNTVDRFDDKENVIISDNEFSDEERGRLEEISRVSNLSLSDVISYVKTGLVINPPSQELLDAKKKHDEMKILTEMVSDNQISPEKLVKMRSLFKLFEDGAFYEKGDLLSFEGIDYRVNQSHVAREIYPPGSGTEALYSPILTSPDGEILPWQQPIPPNGYQLGDKVSHKQKIWESTHAGLNVWEPGAIGVYDTIWKEVK